MKKILLFAVISVVIVSVSITSISAQSQYEIPSWVKGVAGFWAEDKINDGEFGEGLTYLIDNDIIKVPKIRELEINNNGLQTQVNNLISQNSGLREDIAVLKNENEQPKSVSGASIFAYTIKDDGDFYVTYNENPNSMFEYSMKEWLQKIGYFDGQMQFLNSNFKLPYDIEVVLKECNQITAFYDHRAKQIVMCYEFIESVVVDFITYYTDNGVEFTEDSISEDTSDVIDWVFYHEVGHALTIMYGLPYTGLSENVADQFASYIILTEPRGFVGDKYNLIYRTMSNIGTWFFIQGNSGQANVYWDVHNLSIQRFYNTSCHAYGNNPEINSELVTQGWLPQERAISCKYEYDVLEDSWNRLLTPYRI